MCCVAVLYYGTSFSFDVYYCSSRQMWCLWAHLALERESQDEFTSSAIWHDHDTENSSLDFYEQAWITFNRICREMDCPWLLVPVFLVGACLDRSIHPRTSLLVLIDVIASPLVTTSWAERQRLPIECRMVVTERAIIYNHWARGYDTFEAIQRFVSKSMVVCNVSLYKSSSVSIINQTLNQIKQGIQSSQAASS